ncbi:transcription factor S [uncultured Methanospirillum sp.]|uniref:transcription factor S n=1 Tax=uncultured Methanospirillum sp. TaxID=262503 RepID=UPI0029C81A34|nr:transcription factor S [uncultured Methanospirillum sp.]
MMFCLKCGRMLKNQSGSFVCPGCGWTKDDAPGNLMTKVDKRKEKEIVIVDDTEKIHTLPTIAIRCPECGNNEAEWWLRQLRSADESEVRFFRCTKCSKTWREYD